MFDVEALRYNGPRVPWTVWWVGERYPTDEPLKHIAEGVDRAIIRKARKKQGKRVVITGCSQPTELEPAMMACSNIPVPFQRAGGCCALNALLNGCPPQVAEQLRGQRELTSDTFMELKKLVHLVNNLKKTPVRLLRLKSIDNTLLIDFLLSAQAGVFLLQCGTHCVTWDCGRSVIFDPDPRTGNYALSLTRSNIHRLGRALYCYEIKCS